jgi:hypothetical protein
MHARFVRWITVAVLLVAAFGGFSAQARGKAAGHLDVTNLPCSPSCPKTLEEGASSMPGQQLVLEQDTFDWEDAGIGAGGGIALMFAGVVGVLEARKHRILAR